MNIRFSDYFSYPFVWYLLIVGVLVSLCAALFGVVLILKRFSFIGDGLAHVAFGATAIATALSFTDNILIVLPITILCAVLLLKTGQETRIKGDAAVAVVSVGALALGYLILSINPSSSANVAGDVCDSLFGSFAILVLTPADVWTCVILSAIVITLFLLLYHKIFAVTFDEEFARAVGVRASLYNLFLAVITAVIIVLAMNLVGSLLISALIVFPALCAMLLFGSFQRVIVCSAVLSVICAVVGILTSLAFSTPIGPTIVVVDMLAFAVCFLVGRFCKR
ncbi:MAG: metal ABC transporter permease [Clostridia bacterium]|nr:metal ABC transporter permease [Clostridia bacterium]